MKSITAKTMALIAVSTALFSFSSKPGGEGFEIYLNNKVMIQQYGREMNTGQSLRLDQASPDDKLTIRYHHCGKTGKNRVVTIKNGQDKVLKEFRYADAATQVSSMTVQVKEILNIKNAASTTLRLYYTSSELPAGRMLASLNTIAPATVKR